MGQMRDKRRWHAGSSRVNCGGAFLCPGHNGGGAHHPLPEGALERSAHGVQGCSVHYSLIITVTSLGTVKCT